VVTPAPSHPLPFALLLVLVTLATCVAMLVGAGNPAFVLAPALGAAVLWGIWKGPLRYPAMALLLLGLTLDPPMERPGNGRWDPPLAPLGRALFDNLNNLTGIGPLRFAAIDLLILALLGLLVFRKAMKRDQDGPVSVQTASCLVPSLLLALGGVVFMEAWGLARGGDVKNSLWQIRHLLFMPLLAFLFQASFRGPADHRKLGAIILFAGLLKALFSIHVYETVYRPLNEKPHYITTHSDSLLYASATVLVLARWHERRDATSWLLVLGALPLLGLGMYTNNRRLVYVSIAAALLVIYSVIPRTAVKRAITRGLMLMLPLIPLYVAVGWNSTDKLFRPVQTLRSMADANSNRSTATREVENYNLYVTLRPNPLMGTGFGHMYVEEIQADDISQFFAQYRFIPHNSLLGLWAFGGVLGFTALWMPLLVAVYLAVRSHRHARHPDDRAAALTIIAVIIAYAVQAYGDMGVQSWMSVFLVATALAVSGKLAVAVGAWPERVRAPRPQPSYSPPAAPQELSA
jgi:hypothetical protein